MTIIQHLQSDFNRGLWEISGENFIGMGKGKRFCMANYYN